MDIFGNDKEIQRPSFALILEGGGNRGAFTNGILDWFLDNQITFSTVIGVSAGALNGANFLAGHRERLRYGFFNTYMKNSNFLKSKKTLDMVEWFHCFHEGTHRFDYETMMKNKMDLQMVALQVETGGPVYFAKRELKNFTDFVAKCMASCSIPAYARPVFIEGQLYLDGGYCDAIPLQQAIRIGSQRFVIILTRVKDYQKHPQILSDWEYGELKNFPGLLQTIAQRHIIYNQSLHLVEEYEKNHQAIVYRPAFPVDLDVSSDLPHDIETLYCQGYQMANCRGKELIAFLRGDKGSSA